MTLDEMKNDYDWQQAFIYANTIRTATGCDRKPFDMNDVASILAFENGDNDGPSWVMAGILKDGRFFFLDAGCDYTGWDCQAGGDAQVANNLDNLIRFGMDENGRERLKFSIPDTSAVEDAPQQPAEKPA